MCLPVSQANAAPAPTTTDRYGNVIDSSGRVISGIDQGRQPGQAAIDMLTARGDAAMQPFAHGATPWSATDRSTRQDDINNYVSFWGEMPGGNITPRPRPTPEQPISPSLWNMLSATAANTAAPQARKPIAPVTVTPMRKF
jgi:hypothetical protein